MAIFNFGKKLQAKTNPVEPAAAPSGAAAGPDAGVKVLGGGCQKCNQLEAATKEALAELGMDTAVGHITDYAQIAACGVMSTPALMVDGKVVSAGRVLKKEEVAELLRKARPQG